ncbi:hypothetical protein CBS101457_000315 [Exobasidium rhododendri]|nr:hypothetical protein CBS101457_000315 [Exobasidium rhododendri]
MALGGHLLTLTAASPIINASCKPLVDHVSALDLGTSRSSPTAAESASKEYARGEKLLATRKPCKGKGKAVEEGREHQRSSVEESSNLSVFEKRSMFVTDKGESNSPPQEEVLPAKRGGDKLVTSNKSNTKVPKGRRPKKVPVSDIKAVDGETVRQWLRNTATTGAVHATLAMNGYAPPLSGDREVAEAALFHGSANAIGLIAHRALQPSISSGVGHVSRCIGASCKYVKDQLLAYRHGDAPEEHQPSSSWSADAADEAGEHDPHLYTFDQSRPTRSDQDRKRKQKGKASSVESTLVTTPRRLYKRDMGNEYCLTLARRSGVKDRTFFMSGNISESNGLMEYKETFSNGPPVTVKDVAKVGGYSAISLASHAVLSHQGVLPPFDIRDPSQAGPYAVAHGVAVGLFFPKIEKAATSLVKGVKTCIGASCKYIKRQGKRAKASPFPADGTLASQSKTNKKGGRRERKMSKQRSFNKVLE